MFDKLDGEWFKRASITQAKSFLETQLKSSTCLVNDNCSKKKDRACTCPFYEDHVDSSCPFFAFDVCNYDKLVLIVEYLQAGFHDPENINNFFLAECENGYYYFEYLLNNNNNITNEEVIKSLQYLKNNNICITECNECLHFFTKSSLLK
jgi:hypothetical protein